ncbi:MAG: substrate-binding domain-containing protein [Verrucomicrobiota bacterium]|jgi:LacI family transcriptional regulator
MHDRKLSSQGSSILVGERLPQRTSLVAETAAVLKEWIKTGILRGIVPGELRLKSRLDVGRDTLRLALKTLEHEGWVTAPARGCQRRVVSQRPSLPRPPSGRPLPVTFLSPQAVVDRIILLELEDLQRHLAKQGRELRFLSPRIFHLSHPHGHLERLTGENPSAAWILHFTGRAVQEWFEHQGLPTFIYGTPYPGVTLPYVVNDWESAAFHAGLQLARQGHRFVGILSFEEPGPGALAVERGVRRALATLAPPGQTLVFKDQQTPESVARSLEMVFKINPRPTALVFSSSSQLLTSLSWMVSRGIGVPADVSLVCIPSDSWFQDLYPPICHYENNPIMFARHIRHRVIELVETGHVVRRSLRVRLEYRAGQSIGPAPRPAE